MDNHAECQLKVEELQEIIKKKNEKIHKLNEMISIEKFGVNRFTYDDDMIEFYTGFPTYSFYIAFFNAIKPTAQKMKKVYYKTSDDLSLRKKPKSMILVDELFMFLCRLRCGFLTEDLFVRFNIHKYAVSRKILTWTNYLHFILGSINIWPTRYQIVQNMPQDFEVLYPRTRIIIYCTEVFTEKPSSLALASKTFLSYKSLNTWKGLVGIAPHGAVQFISSLYTGCKSDVVITKSCGLIDLLKCGDEVMADKGFVLNKILQDRCIQIRTPIFCSDGQFNSSEMQENQKIASLGIQVEIHIKRVKKYSLLQSVVSSYK